MVCFEHGRCPGLSAITTARSNLRETYLTVPGSIPVNKNDISNERRILQCPTSHALLGFTLT